MLEGLIIFLILGIIVSIIKGIYNFFKFIINFIKEHKVATIITILVIAFIFYCVKAEHPFAFLPVIVNGIVKVFKAIGHFLWITVYKHTIWDTIWVYAVIILALYFLSLSLTKVCDTTKKRNIFCTVISIGAIAFTLFDGISWYSIIEIAELLFSTYLLWLFRVHSLCRIGSVKDVEKRMFGIVRFNFQTSVLRLIILFGLIDKINEIFETTIPKEIPLIIICGCYFLIQIYYYICTFRGYIWISNFIENNEFFYYTDYSENTKLHYLYDYKEYVLSVTNNLIEQKRIYVLPFDESAYINQYCKRIIERGILANQTSDDIALKLHTNFREIGFERVYKTIFKLVKGYEIEFRKNMEDRALVNNDNDITATEFVLMRYPIEEHPILKENKYEKERYIVALDSLVRKGKIDEGKWEAKREEFQKVFNVETLSEKPLEAIVNFSRKICRKANFFKTYKTDYRYLLLLEATYFRNLLTEEDITYKEIEFVFEYLKVQGKERDFIYRYIKALFIEGDILTAEKLLNEAVKKDIRDVLRYIHRNIMWNVQYIKNKQYNVAVVSTMGSGKSTFINSILGIDYIPAKNQACTAKITTIRDNDALKRIIGCYTKTDGSKVYSNIIDNNILDKWNEDKEVTETILEGNIEDISSDDMVLIIHDTPGVDNAADSSHHDKTFGFVESKCLDMIIYLFNAEHISSKDSEKALLELKDTIKKDTKIIFGINKIDCFCSSKEDNIGESIKELLKQLKSYGFTDPIIFPFSANAARLFKLVLKQQKITAKERKDFKKFLKNFSSFDASEYITGARSSKKSELYYNLKKDEKIIVKEDEYNYSEIITALENTGIISIENWISEQMCKKQDQIAKNMENYLDNPIEKQQIC